MPGMVEAIEGSTWVVRGKDIEGFGIVEALAIV